MKPRTQKERLFDELQKTLPPITKSELNYGIKHSFKKFGYKTKNGVTCMECGCRFDTDKPKDVCPECGTRLTIKETQRQSVKEDVATFGIMTVVGGYQVHRIFYMKAFTQKGRQARYSYSEIIRTFFDKDGRPVYFAKTLSNYGHIKISENISLKKPTAHYGYNQYCINPDSILIKRIIPELKLRGLHKSFHGVNPENLIYDLLHNPKIETLLKAKQYEAVSYFCNNITSLSKVWSAIKICIRNKYKLKDMDLWHDYVYHLIDLGEDIHNAKNVCPME